MSTQTLLAMIVPAALAVSGVAADAQWVQTVNKTFPAGRTGTVAFVYSLNPDCSAMGIPEVRVINPPSHGRVQVRPTLGYTSFRQSNQRYECNRRRSRGAQISYTPQSGYVGDDSFSLETFFPSGHAEKRDFHISIK